MMRQHSLPLRGLLVKLALGLLLFPGCGRLAAADKPALQFVGDHPLPGRATRWDYISLAQELVEIDPATDTIVQRTALTGADGNYGLLIVSRQVSRL